LKNGHLRPHVETPGEMRTSWESIGKQFRAKQIRRETRRSLRS
jgi:hypothetical protein